MAAGAEISGEAAKHSANSKSELRRSESEFNSDVNKLVEIFTKLNPLAKEFFPSNYSKQHSFNDNNLSPKDSREYDTNLKLSANDNNPINRRVLISSVKTLIRYTY